MDASNLLNELIGSLNPGQKLIVEAVNKMIEGKRLFQEGLLELSHLTGGQTSLRPVTHPGKNPPSARAVTKPGAPSSRVNPAKDEIMSQRIADFICANGPTSINNLMRKFHIHFYRLTRISRALVAQGKLSYVHNGKLKTLAPPDSKPGPSPRTRTKAPSVRFSLEDRKKEVLDVIRKADGWATKILISDKVKVDRRPLTKVLEALKEEGAVRAVFKKNNPSHKDPRALAREREYYETA